MAKRNKAKFPSKGRKSALRIEALEQRQLLAAVTGSGTEVGSNISHPNGNVYDQVLMTGSSVTVGADAGQVTRVSFMDLNGDIVQAEFAGTGTMTVSLADFGAAAVPTTYNQPGVSYVKGNATFLIQGSDATTNFSTFSVGPGNAVSADLFTGGLKGGDNLANVQSLQIVSNPQNPGGFSNFGGIRAGNAVFAASSGTVGIAAANVNVQGPVIIGDVDGSNAAVPTLNFGTNSQFSSLTVAGGDLLQTNGATIVGGTARGVTSINYTTGATSLISTGSNLAAQIVPAGIAWSQTPPATNTLDTASAFDLTGKSQSDINTFFTGRTFTAPMAITGNLATGLTITAVEFRGKVTVTGDLGGTLTTTSTQAGKGLTGGLEVTGALSSAITTNGLATLTVGGALTGSVTVNGTGGNLGAVSLGSVAAGRISASSIGNVTVTGNVTGDGGGNGWVFRTTGAAATSLGPIGTLTVGGDVSLSNRTTKLIDITGTGTFGNVTISGGGTLGGVGTVAALNLGRIVVSDFGVGSTTTGTISITDTVNLDWNGADIGTGAAIASGTLGDITITGGGLTGSGLTISGVVGGNGVGTDLITIGNVTVTNFNNVTVDNAADGAINAPVFQGSKMGNVSITTIAGTTTAGQTSSITLWDFVSLSDGATTTGEIMGNVTLDAGQTTGNTLAIHKFNTFAQFTAGATIGDVTLSGKTVTINDDIQANTIGAVSITGTTTMSNAVGIKSASAVGAVTVTGALNLAGASAAADGNIEVKDVGAINVTGNLTIGSVGTGFAQGAGIVSTGTLTSLTVGGAATFNSTNATNIQGNIIGDIAITGLSTFTANHANGTIRANDGTSALDTIGNVTLGRVVGAAGVEIQGSSVGNVTISGALTQDQTLVSALDIIATPNAGSNSAKSEQVLLDGSNLSSYAIGNISVSSTLALAYTGTELFSGDNSFVALGKIGTVNLTGANAGAQQSALLAANTDGVTIVVGDVDGQGNQTANLPSTFHTGSVASATPDYTAGTVSIGNVTVNTQQTTSTAGYSGVDNISGSNASGFEGLVILSGVRANTAAGALGDILTMASAGTGTLNVGAIDAQLKGTLGSVLISSNNAVGLRADQTNVGAVNNAQAAVLQQSAIVANTSAGAIQSGAVVAATAANKAIIIGDTNGVADAILETGEAVNQIVVVVL